MAQVLPFFYSDLVFVEEGCHIINHQDRPLFLISPDGSAGVLSQADVVQKPNPRLAFEIKCPTGNIFTTTVHYKIPDRYIMQVLSEMAALDVNVLLYVCWTEESSTVIEVKMDDDLWNTIREESVSIYMVVMDSVLNQEVISAEK